MLGEGDCFKLCGVTLARPGLGLVVSPLIAMMVDQVSTLQKSNTGLDAWMLRDRHRMASV